MRGDTAQLTDLRRSGGGAIAQRLMAAGMNVNALRTNATLRKDEWKELDEAIVRAKRDRLNGIADLRSRNLVYKLKNGLGTTILEHETVSDMRDAEMTMDGVTRVENDIVKYGLAGLPLPMIHKDFQIGIRKLHASRMRGESLDTTQGEIAARKCAELEETILFQGYSSYEFADYKIYGYCDFPQRNVVVMTLRWDDSTKTGKDIVDDVLACKQALIDARHYGPYVLYIPSNYETVVDNDYSADKGDNTVRDRIKKITGIEDVKVADYLAEDNVVLAEMNKETVRVVEGIPVTTVEWQSEGNMMFHFKVMQITVPELRADQNGRSGVAHLAPTST
jgi:uncharacterized linocin/CFP29 family protein